MSDLDLVIKQSKELESMLEEHYGATGRGLHEKVTSVQDQLSPEMVKRLRYIATVRNKLVHDNNYNRLDDKQGFIDACNRAASGLRPAAGKSGCFIATAVYGSPVAPEVMILRDFRDRVLLHHLPGRMFVHVYYALSPTMAKGITKVETIRRLTRRLLDQIAAHLAPDA